MIEKMLRLPRQLAARVNHPVNRARRVAAFKRWLSWQIGSRIVGHPVIVPFVDDTVLVATSGLTGVTGNIFFGLAEFEEMAFALHVLRHDELFVDVGANQGSYSIMAAGAVGARVVAFEPIAAAASEFQRNIRLNDLVGRVELHRAGVGSSASELFFTDVFDTVNHVALPGELGVRTRAVALDDVLLDRQPTLIKIDVEGFEPEVLRGARRTLARESLLALIVETNDSFKHYGFSIEDVLEPLRTAGFAPYAYRPDTRELAALATASSESGNTLFIRDATMVSERLTSAPRYRTASRIV